VLTVSPNSISSIYYAHVYYLLITGVPVDLPNAFGESALHCACAEGHENIVELLLKHQAQPNR
jgi:ankyrin repeat protein